jgi:hypothetical protein
VWQAVETLDNLIREAAAIISERRAPSSALPRLVRLAGAAQPILSGK